MGWRFPAGLLMVPEGISEGGEGALQTHHPLQVSIFSWVCDVWVLNRVVRCLLRRGALVHSV